MPVLDLATAETTLYACRVCGAEDVPIERMTKSTKRGRMVVLSRSACPARTPASGVPSKNAPPRRAVDGTVIEPVTVSDPAPARLLADLLREDRRPLGSSVRRGVGQGSVVRSEPPQRRRAAILARGLRGHPRRLAGRLERRSRPGASIAAKLADAPALTVGLGACFWPISACRRSGRDGRSSPRPDVWTRPQAANPGHPTPTGSSSSSPVNARSSMPRSK